MHVNLIYTFQTSLGVKVEKELERKQKDRKHRRQVFGEINPTEALRSGQNCSPYHALKRPVSFIDHSLANVVNAAHITVNNETKYIYISTFSKYKMN